MLDSSKYKATYIIEKKDDHIDVANVSMDEVQQKLMRENNF